MSSLPTVPALEPLVASNAPVNPYYVAAIIDGVVHQVFNIDGQTTALFLSEPTFIQCDNTVTPGMVYNQTAGTWSLPAAK